MAAASWRKWSIHSCRVGLAAREEAEGAERLGMPLAAELLRPPLWVSEIVYVPLETELLKAARRAGCATMDGGYMTVGHGVFAIPVGVAWMRPLAP